MKVSFGQICLLILTLTIVACNKTNETKFFKTIYTFSKITPNNKFIGLSYKDSSGIDIVLIDYKDSNNITQTTSTSLDNLNPEFVLISSTLDINLTIVKDAIKSLREINCTKIQKDGWTTDRYLLESETKNIWSMCVYSYRVYTEHLDFNKQRQLETNGWKSYSDRIWGKHDCGAVD